MINKDESTPFDDSIYETLTFVEILNNLKNIKKYGK